MLVHSNVRIIRYSNSLDQIVLFGIWYSLISPDWIIFGIRYSLISRNKYYSVFGIRKFPGTNNIRYSVFGQNHYSWQLCFVPDFVMVGSWFLEGGSVAELFLPCLLALSCLPPLLFLLQTNIVNLRQGSGKDRQGLAFKAKGLKA